MFTAVRAYVLQHREGSAVLASSGLFLIIVYVLTALFA
jgi:hypothetical protein